MKFRLPILVLCCMPWMMACTHPETPDTPTIDSNPELVAACQHVEGGGASVKGGDGGTIYRVSRLDDALDPNTGLPQAGTLRYAVTQTGVRRVIFTTSGTIHLNSELRIKTGSITIDGQSAPGDGICIADYPLVINADNVIVRFIRIRLGQVGMQQKGEDYDALSVNDGTGIVIDHCSCSWSIDECVSCYGNENFTLQYCFITESLRDAGHPKGAHGYGGIWGGKNASFHHNLLAHHDSRNPRFDHDYVDANHNGPIDFVNNVVYNWKGNSAYGGEGSSQGAGGRHINFVNNYYKPGPTTNAGVKTRLLNPTTKCSYCTNACGGSVQPGKFYLTGNYMVGSTEVSSDNWQGVFPDESSKKSQCKADIRWTDGMTALLNEQTAEEAYETVLAKAGCSLHRDAVDERIVNEVRNGTGKIIDSPSEVGGWPELQKADIPLDTDYDGIPDEWETKYGLNPKDNMDARKITLVTGYTNIEVYMRHLVRNLYD